MYDASIGRIATNRNALWEVETDRPLYHWPCPNIRIRHGVVYHL